MSLQLARNILAWYGENGRRNLPWRGTRDPWLTLLAGVLLRNTTVHQVAQHYPRIAKQFPTPNALLSAKNSELEELLRPLGMRRTKSKQLRQAARDIQARFGGKVPSGLEDLKSLPGVGDYIAREVMAVSFDREVPLLDRNMARVLNRVNGSQRSIPELMHSKEASVPKGKGRDFGYAILDFAHLICRLEEPLCGSCPLTHSCAFGQSRTSAKGKRSQQRQIQLFDRHLKVLDREA